MSYVDTTQHEGETSEEARRRRRFELARGWRFKCECAKCLAEVADAPAGAVEENLGVEKDESRLELEADIDTERRKELGNCNRTTRLD